MKEKRVGEKQEEGAQGSRREIVCFQTVSYIVESFAIQKVLFHSCVYFLLTIFNGEACRYLHAGFLSCCLNSQISKKLGSQTDTL